MAGEGSQTGIGGPDACHPFQSQVSGRLSTRRTSSSRRDPFLRVFDMPYLIRYRIVGGLVQVLRVHGERENWFIEP